jgi:hypothetical protein
MKDRAQEIDDLRLDIETLRAMIDVALDKGVGGEDVFLRACADVLYDRRKRLDELERVTLYVSRGRSDHPTA